MRLWTIHPCFLDSSGLNGIWRESLLAQKCLINGGGSYYNHPQLDRFKAHENPVEAIGCYLFQIWHESRERSFNYNKGLIVNLISGLDFWDKYGWIKVNAGQISFEREHIASKILRRHTEKQCRVFPTINFKPSDSAICCNPMFSPILENNICEQWEKDPTAWR